MARVYHRVERRLRRACSANTHQAREPPLRHRKGGRVAVVQTGSLPEDVRWSAEFLPAQVSPGSAKTKSSGEKGRDLGQYRVDAQVDGCLMTWEYLVRLRKRAFILPILECQQDFRVLFPNFG